MRSAQLRGGSLTWDKSGNRLKRWDPQSGLLKLANTWKDKLLNYTDELHLDARQF
jgi:hypothetical protein